MFEVYQDKKGKYRWHLKAKNKEVICASSQGFASAFGAKRNAKVTAEKLLKELKK